MEAYINKARTIMEAMPYLRDFSGETIVIKYGGNAMESEELKKQVILDVILLKLVGIHVVVVHGGGPHITALMKRLGKEAVFVEGHRHTDEETMEITEMVLSGSVNKEIVALINSNGGRAVGLSGKDGSLITARKKEDTSGKGLDFGQVGEIVEVNTHLVADLTRDGYIPVISPVAMGKDGKTYNINADVAAGWIAAGLKARRLIYMTDIKGIYWDIHDETSFMPTLYSKDVAEMKQTERLSSGMLPKIDSALLALEGGVEKVQIVDGRVEHSILLELLTDAGIGTQILL